MGLYNMLFGQNPLSDAVLATLGLTEGDVGRFRDCFVTGGEIAVYTRNGGGNRNCWCESNPDYGNRRCQHHTFEREVDEFVLSNGTWGTYQKTGKRIILTYYVCEAPNSAACGCPGCTIEHRLPAHPDYLRDVDDEFDCTYATVYFRFPEIFAAELAQLDSGVEFQPSAMWLQALGALKPAVTEPPA